MGVAGLWKLLKALDCIQHKEGRDAAEWLEGKRLAVDLGSILIPGLLNKKQTNLNPASGATRCVRRYQFMSPQLQNTMLGCGYVNGRFAYLAGGGTAGGSVSMQ